MSGITSPETLGSVNWLTQTDNDLLQRTVVIQGNANAAAFSTVGAAAPTTSGTATAVPVGNTTKLSQLERVALVSAAGAGSLAELYEVVAKLSINKGFTYTATFANTDAVAAGIRFVGLRDIVAASSATANPSTYTNCIGVGTNPNNVAELAIFINDAAGTGIVVPLGPDFPAISTTDFYQLDISANTSKGVVIEITNLERRVGNRQEFSMGVNVPDALTLLNPRFTASNNATAAAVTLVVGRLAYKSNTV